MSHLVSLATPITGAHTVKQYVGFGVLGADIPTTGDNGGSVVLNDSIDPAKEYHWRVVSPPSDGTLTIYPDMSSLFEGAPDGTYNWTYELFEDGVSQGAAVVTEQVGAGETSLVITNSRHAHAADSLTLGTTGSASLVVQEANHAHIVDGIGLTTQWLLVVADALHAHAADTITLGTTGATSLAVQEALHGHSADNAALTTQWLLLISEARHSHAGDNLSLDTTGTVSLTIAEALSAHAADNLSFSPDTYLAIAEAIHAHAADSLTLDTSNATFLTVQKATHSHSTDGIGLSLDTWLFIVAAAHVHTSDAPMLSANTALQIAEALHSQYADVAVLSLASGETTLTVADISAIAAAVLAAINASPDTLTVPKFIGLS